MGFSKSNIQRAGIRHDSRGWGIAGLYGILTRASEQGNEECVEVGRRIIPVSTLEKEKLKPLAPYQADLKAVIASKDIKEGEFKVEFI